MARTRVSKRQLAFLEHLVWYSKDADSFTKQCVIFLIRKSEGLTKPVKLVLGRDLRSKIAEEMHRMCMFVGTTHIDDLFRLAGSELGLYSSLCMIGSARPADDAEEFSPSSDEISAIQHVDPWHPAK